MTLLGERIEMSVANHPPECVISRQRHQNSGDLERVEDSVHIATVKRNEVRWSHVLGHRQVPRVSRATLYRYLADEAA